MKEITETLSKKHEYLLRNNGFVKRYEILCIGYRNNDN